MPISWFLKTIFPIVPQGKLTAQIIAATNDIKASIWDNLSNQNQENISNPFLSHAFFLSLEQSSSAVKETGWLPQHILLEQDEKPVGLMPLFLKSHSMGEYVFDHAWADALERAGAPYYPKLQSSIPFTPVNAPKLLVPDGNETYKSALLDTAQQLASHHGASSVHATFVTAKEEKLAKTNGWLVRNDIQFHWKNENYDDFESFLGTLTSRKRKLIRSERKKSLANGIKISWLKGSDIKEHHWDSFFEFYQDTGARKWGQPYLNRSFFSYLSQNMPQSLLLMLACEGDRFIAGALNFIGSDTLFGRYWGCTKNIAQKTYRFYISNSAIIRPWTMQLPTELKPLKLALRENTNWPEVMCRPQPDPFTGCKTLTCTGR